MMLDTVLDIISLVWLISIIWLVQERKYYVHDDLAAEDIASESLIKLWEKLKVCFY
jgi:hypothetical protein